MLKRHCSKLPRYNTLAENAAILRINQFFDDFANGTIIAFYRPTRIRTSIWQVNSDGHLKEQASGQATNE
jgi:hypothetical protein